jgi:DNA mismatch repair protein MutS
LSLAWAAARHIAREIGALTLFATHYFELTALPDELPATANVHLDATEHKGELVFLHRVKDGPANKSYGLVVAGLAGVPVAVIDDAKRYLKALELAQAESTALEPQQALELVASGQAAADEPDSAQSATLQTLAGIDVDALSPREALQLLYELVEKTKQAAKAT